MIHDLVKKLKKQPSGENISLYQKFVKYVGPHGENVSTFCNICISLGKLLEKKDKYVANMTRKVTIR